MSQWYCHIAGQRHGPMSEEQLRAWAQNGTLKREDHVWCEGMAEWAPGQTIPDLFPAAPAAQAPPSPYAQTPPSPYMQPPSPYMQPTSPYGMPPSQFVKPHRGGTVLTLGIIGIACCLICGIIAWVMGNNDLKEMAAGRMDRSGEGMTRAGKICGIISVILACVGLVVQVILFAAQAANA